MTHYAPAGKAIRRTLAKKQLNSEFWLMPADKPEKQLPADYADLHRLKPTIAAIL
jgi:hypothetical protein